MKFLASFFLLSATVGGGALARRNSTVPGGSGDATDDDTFAAYLRRFEIAVADDEYAARKAVFLSNLAAVQAHNADPRAGWTMSVNQWSHLTQAEFADTLARGYNKRVARDALAATGAVVEEAPLHTHVPEDQLPRSLDWRKRKPAVVTAVKNQASCGSCWAFSATESVESHLAINFGTLLTLSPQQLVDCAPNPDHCGGTGGCDGSTCPLAFEYARLAGVLSEAQYPYKGTTDPCATQGLKPVATIGGYVSLPTNNYTALMNAVQIEPVSISVAASAWGPYTGGIFDSATCGQDINHAVQLVGYGVDKGVKYWTIRNSWGPDWGEDGYIRLKRFSQGTTPCGVDNTPQDGTACEGHDDPVKVCGLCGILSDSSYPTGGSIA